MPQIEKLRRKFFEKPVRNDITFEEVEKLSEYYGCIVKKSGGKHPMKVIGKTAWQRLKIRRDDLYGREAE